DTPILQDLDKQDAHGDLIMDIADSIYKDKNGYYVVIVSNKNKNIKALYSIVPNIATLEESLTNPKENFIKLCHKVVNMLKYEW
ncbi:MAG: hypothetical protein GX931_01810, partial [Acholeplasmataceae bacterium]|nr:hypothetical protein [Acholeplasmataceae bacterium]